MRIEFIRRCGPKSRAHWEDVIQEAIEHNRDAITLTYPQYSRDLRKKKVMWIHISSFLINLIYKVAMYLCLNIHILQNKQKKERKKERLKALNLTKNLDIIPEGDECYSSIGKMNFDFDSASDAQEGLGILDGDEVAHDDKL